MKKLFCAMLALALTLCGLAMAETIERVRLRRVRRGPSRGH